MTQAIASENHSFNFSKTIFGFWVYIMTDCILFSCFFAAYAVLHNGTFGGPSARDLFSLPYALCETFILLASSFTCGLIMLAAHKHNLKNVLIFCIVTFLLGLSFLGLELHEFSRLVEEGNGPSRSAFLSSYFTLVGTHGLHITAGLLWVIVLMVQFMGRGLTEHTFRRLCCFSMFWHFLDVVWIFIFTIVYLMGEL